MKITFLGTSGGAPTKARNVTSVALQQAQSSALWLFDCGEGTQHQILRSPLRLSRLERIFVTHLHGDHIYGLLGLLCSRSLSLTEAGPVTLYGPEGLQDYLECALRVSHARLRYEFSVKTVKPGLVYEDDRQQVFCEHLAHRIECYGYAVVEKERAGTLDAEKAARLGVSFGPDLGRLKNGETITLPDGGTVAGAEVMGPAHPGRKLVICGDTGPTPNAVALAHEADVLVHEATFVDEDLELAERAAHSTASMAARVAREAGAITLILTHFSARYESDGAARLAQLLAQAQAIFPNTLLAEDFWSYDIPADG